MKVKFKFKVYLPVIDVAEPNDTVELIVEEGEIYEIISYSLSLQKVLMKNVDSGQKIAISKEDFDFCCTELKTPKSEVKIND